MQSVGKNTWPARLIKPQFPHKSLGEIIGEINSGLQPIAAVTPFMIPWPL